MSEFVTVFELLHLHITFIECAVSLYLTAAAYRPGYVQVPAKYLAMTTGFHLFY